MSRFNFTLKHVLGTKIEKADGLSRRPDWKVGVENDNKNQVVIKGPEVDIVEKIKKARSKDKKVVRVVEEIKKVGVNVVREDEWQIERNLVLKEGKVYMPRDKRLRKEIIWLHYDTPVARYGEK